MHYNPHILDRMIGPAGEIFLKVRVERLLPEELSLLRQASPVFAKSSVKEVRGEETLAIGFAALRSEMEAAVRILASLPDFARLSAEMGEMLEGERRSRHAVKVRMECRGRELDMRERTLVMGILNVTPDSFSDGGSYITIEAAVRRAKEMEAEGADLIDLGGESTRPGAEKVPLETELERVIPVVKALQGEIGIPISIDTYKAEVAREALKAGAHLINDQWRLTADPEMARVIRDFGCPVILMHNNRERKEGNIISSMISDLRESLDIAKQAGIREDRIILDPGIGFAKSYEDNLTVMNGLKALSCLGYPVLLATSRKSMIRLTLDLPPDDVVEGTAATLVYGMVQGCQMVRVHDVKQMKRVVKMADAMLDRGLAVD
jgi:dihydropteroate synthase